jgi:hypothetical protein
MHTVLATRTLSKKPQVLLMTESFCGNIQYVVTENLIVSHHRIDHQLIRAVKIVEVVEEVIGKMLIGNDSMKYVKESYQSQPVEREPATFDLEIRS